MAALNIFKTVTLNVTTTNNLAGIRTDSKGVINNNAIGIITKKYQQNSKGVFVIDEGMFKDTDSDFELFKNSNVEVFKELDKFDSKIFPIGFATGKAKLPTRFALWLQTELLNRYGLVTELNSSKTGLISKSITQNKSQKIFISGCFRSSSGGDLRARPAKSYPFGWAKPSNGSSPPPLPWVDIHAGNERPHSTHSPA